MDGNGRWGLKKKGSRNYGHLKGIKSVEEIIKASAELKIPFLTLYTFSTDNWKRPENEITDDLFKIIDEECIEPNDDELLIRVDTIAIDAWIRYS